MRNISHREKKLACLLLDLASSTQRTMIVNNSFRVALCFITVDNTGGKTWSARLTPAVVWRHVEQEAVLVRLYAHFVFETRIPPQGGASGGPEYLLRVGRLGRIWLRQQKWISDANFHSNYGSVLLSFWDMTMVQTDVGQTDDGSTSATIALVDQQ